MTTLNDAIQLIRQGRKDEARQMLEPMLKADPKNIQVWFWYVETMPTLEKRIQILDVCLKANPGNAQVVQVLQKLRARQAAQSPSAPFSSPPPVSAPAGRIETPWTPASQPPVTPAFDFDGDEPASSASDMDDAPLSVSTPKPAFDWDALESQNVQKAAPVPSFLPPEPEKPVIEEKPKQHGRSYPFYEVWLLALTTWDVRTYADLLDDPEAGTGRAFEWMAYTGVVTGLISPFIILNNPQYAQLAAQPEFQSLTRNLSTTTFMVILAVAMAIISPLSGILGLALSGAIQNVLAVVFHGKGNFRRTVYALGAYLAPLSLVSTLVSLIPIAGQCLGSLLGLYAIVLNVRALRAAHYLSVGDAIKVLIAPTVILLIVGCLFLLLIPGLASR